MTEVLSSYWVYIHRSETIFEHLTVNIPQTHYESLYTLPHRVVLRFLPAPYEGLGLGLGLGVRIEGVRLKGFGGPSALLSPAKGRRQRVCAVPVKALHYRTTLRAS